MHRREIGIKPTQKAEFSVIIYLNKLLIMGQLLLHV